MKIKVFLGCFVLIIATALFSFTSIEFAKEHNKNERVQYVTGVNSVSKLRAELVAIDSIQAGVCDTCFSSVTGVIIENRLMVAKISRQNYEMEQLIEHNNVQLNKLKMYNKKIAYVIQRSRNHQREYDNYMAKNNSERKARN